MSTRLAILATTSEKPKSKRENIAVIETTPKDNWFLKSKTSRGRVVWYLRLQVTGMHARLCGPFKSKRQSLLFLDDAISGLADWSSDLTGLCEKRMITEECHYIWPPIVEHPMLGQPHSPTLNGR